MEIGLLTTAQEAEKKSRALGMPELLAEGNVFWVDGVGGDDSQDGLTPSKPLKKIDTALGLCSNDNNDYIFVLDCYQQDTFPIVVDVTKVHIIGVVNKSNRYAVMLPSGDTAIFTIASTGNDCEIAGFDLSAGAAHGSIELNNPIGIHIHDCIFGSDQAGGTPQDGIIAETGQRNPIHGLIENCKFYGTGNSANGKLTRDGIRDTGGGSANFKNMTLQNNLFLGIPGICIDLDRAQGAMILNNRFALDANTAGAAITLGAATAGCFIDGNSANFGKTEMAANPYVDGSAVNSWGINYNAITATLP